MNEWTTQTGFTLIEVLITLVVVSVGLLGLMGLQTHALGRTLVASQDTLAAIAIDDMMDRILANQAPGAASVYAAIEDNRSTAGPDCRRHECRPGEMARHDTRHWQATLARQLPEGRGRIRCLAHGDKTGCRHYRVSIAWVSPPRAEGPTDSTVLNACRDFGAHASEAPNLRCLTEELRL